MARVLLVMEDGTTGTEVADALEGSGHEVMWCPGPQAPTYVCQGGRGTACPLTSAADVVIVDGWLASDAQRCGTPSWHLAHYYRERGLPVVFLIGPDGLIAPLRDAEMRAIPRSSDPAEIERAVAELLAASDVTERSA